MFDRRKRNILNFILQEMLALEALLLEVDGQKYSCRASSILDSEDVADQISALSVKERKLVSDATVLFNIKVL